MCTTDQEIVVIKLAHNVRLVEANEQNGIRFRLIFVNLRDGVGKKALQVFSAVHHKLHKCSMEIQLHQQPFSKKTRPRGDTGSQVECEPAASRSEEEEEHRAGLQKCTTIKMRHGGPGAAAETVVLLLP